VTQPFAEDAYPEWEEALTRLASATGSVLITGASDVGKTTFTRRLINRVLASGRAPAVLDADIGQSEIGPPGCVGLATVRTDFASLSSQPADYLAFVGSTSPIGLLLEYVGAIRRTLDASRAPVTVIDTGGLISGVAGRRLHQALLDTLRPAHIVTLQRKSELAGVLGVYRQAPADALIQLPVPACIGAKAPAYRAMRRGTQFAAYFADAKTHLFTFDQVRFANSWLGSGTPVPGHILKYLNETLAGTARVYYGEIAGPHLGLMVSRGIRADLPGVGVALKQLRAEQMTASVAPRWKHLLVGLEAQGRMLGMGIVESLDFRRRTLGVLTPLRAPGAASTIRIGLFRVQPDGKELGPVGGHEI
jgi:polynucleotide 5'-hydroxyl-kinase GRC3/NOL9